MIVRRSDMAELEGFAAFPGLVAEYAQECATDGMPPPAAKMVVYHRLELGGSLHVLVAIEEDRLAGFLILLVPVLPHYGVSVTISESFFVGKEHRRSLAGLKLLAAAEEMAFRLRSPGLFVSAPSDGKLFEVLPRCGFVETGRTFFKKVA